MTESATAQAQPAQQQQHQQQQQQQQQLVKNLSIRSVKKIVEVPNTQTLKTESFFLQVLSVKEYDTNEKDAKKCVKLRFQLSDGESTVLAMMQKQVYDKMEDSIASFDVIEVFSFVRQTIKERNILVLTKPPKLVYGKLKMKIGTPKDYSQNLKDKAFDKDCPQEQVSIPMHVIKKQAAGDDNLEALAAAMEDTEAEDAAAQSNKDKGKDMQEYYTPIKALSTFIYDWRIKARLTKKGPKKSWKNNRSEGYFINIELMDNHGTMIQATFFKDACDKFDPILKEGCIYLCSNGTVKLANQRFATVKNDFCLVFDKNAEINEVPDDSSIEQKGYNFASLIDVPAIGQSQMRIIDVIGILTDTGETISIHTKAGETRTKRVLTLCDDSGVSIEMTVWGTVAESFDGIDEADPVIAFKGCRVTDFQGWCLTMDHDAVYELNPELPRSRELKQWYSNTEKANIRPTNQGRQADAAGSKLESSGRLVGEMNEMFQGDPEAMRQMHAQGNNGATYFTVSGYVTYIKNDEKAFYLACPNEDCRRKVHENDGTIESQHKYRCDHCQTGFDNCLPTYMLLVKISDFSDSVFVNFYRQQAETVMKGVSAEKVKQLKEQGEFDTVSQIFFDAQWQHYTFTIQSKLRQFNDDLRLNFACIRATPHSFNAENRQLLKRLELYSNIPDQMSN